MQPLEIGVCTWSINRVNPEAGIAYAGGTLGLRVVHAGFFDEPALAAADPDRMAQTAREAGVQIAAMFIGFPGVDYSTLATVAATSGLMPDDRYPQRLDLVRRAADFTAALGVLHLGVHIGTIPPDRTSPARAKLMERVREAAGILEAHKISLLVETGPEPAELLCVFLDECVCDNLTVCLDPANLITYGSDDPARAVGRLKGLIRIVHIKDAVATASPGIGLGRQAPIGTGEAQIPRVLSKLRVGGYTGPLLIETDTRAFGLESLASARDYLRSMLV